MYILKKEGWVEGNDYQIKSGKGTKSFHNKIILNILIEKRSNHY